MVDGNLPVNVTVNLFLDLNLTYWFVPMSRVVWEFCNLAASLSYGKAI